MNTPARSRLIALIGDSPTERFEFVIKSSFDDVGASQEAIYIAIGKINKQISAHSPDPRDAGEVITLLVMLGLEEYRRRSSKEIIN